MALKVKLTPLNLISAIGLVSAAMLFISKAQPQHPQHIDLTGTLAWLSVLAAVVFFVSDLIFRRFIPSFKKLWMVEGVLVIFMVILIFIIKSSIN